MHSNPKQKWLGRIVVLAAVILMILALWPDARSLYDLTGEEELPDNWPVSSIGSIRPYAPNPSSRRMK
ncbi:MAG: hypothetical protein R3C44_09215 [Chloroflexota bacterium]